MIVWDGFTLVGLVIVGIGFILYILSMVLDGIEKVYEPVVKVENSLGLPFGVKAIVNYVIALFVIALLCRFFKV
jgi:hypothetical protein